VKLRAIKKVVQDDADFALIFQDEMEIHRHPALTRMWAAVGRQPEVPAPGQNEKKVVYGGVDYMTGKLTYTVADTKSGAEFLAFLIVLVTKYVGRKILLVCDNGRFHITKAVQQWLADHRDQIEVFWLPPYSPSLNLIERLWGHIKRTVLANVLYASLDELVAAFRHGARYLTGNRSRMTFMFDHDDFIHEPTSETRRKAA
jgi:transposase